MKPDHLNFFVDPSRCIGCQACMQACSECDTHRGESMIHLEYIDRAESVQTVPVVCMHCEQPTCAEVCPADAIKRTADGVVQSARKPRCIACGNCVVACPFGVPEVYEDRKLMMKCDMCYDRTSIGKKPMCATVCPSQALFYGTAEEIEQLRPMSAPTNRFQFGRQTITTRVFVMAPRGLVSRGAVSRRHGRARRCGRSPPRVDQSSRMRSVRPGGDLMATPIPEPRNDHASRQTAVRPTSSPRGGRTFPIDWPQDQYVERRDFVKFLTLTSLAFAVGQLWIAGQSWMRTPPAAARVPPHRVARARSPSAASLAFDYPHAARFMRPGPAHGIASSSRSARSARTCRAPSFRDRPKACFIARVTKALFDLRSGRVIAGPPPRPLPRIVLELIDDDIYATGVDTRTG